MRASSRIGGLTLLALGLASGCVHERVVVDGELQPEALERVARRTAALRRLSFERSVLSEGVTAEEQREVMRRFVEARRQDLERKTHVYHRLGVLPSYVSLAAAGPGGARSALAGFYLYEVEPARLYVSLDYDMSARLQLDVIGALTGVDWAYELPLTHELVHALQDHHLDLSRFLSSELERTNEDLALVRRSILESEANLLGFAHFHGLSLDGWLERRLHRFAVESSYAPYLWAAHIAGPRSPRFLSKLTLGHYVRGIDFVLERLDEGGWAAMDRAYREGLPESTEQLLFPEKRRGRPGYDPPRSLAPLDEAPPVLDGYERVASNVFGALQWQLLLEEGAPFSSTPRRVARGWGGDRYEVWARELPAGDVHTVMMWRTVWDSVDDAVAFEAEYRRRLAQKYPERLETLAVSRGAEGEAWSVAPADPRDGGVPTRRPEVAVLVRRGARVLIVEGAPVGAWQQPASWGWENFEEGAPALASAQQGEVVEGVAVDVGGEPEAVLTLDEGRVPPLPEPGLGLRARFQLPRRTLALRLGAAVAVEPVPEAAAALVSLQPDLEVRWGIREGLEWSPPFLLSFEVSTALGQTVVTGGLGALSFALPGWDLHARPAFGLTHAVHLADVAAIAGQLTTDLDVLASSLETTFVEAALGAGLFLEPLEGLTLGFGVAREERLDVGGPVLERRRRAPLGGIVRVGSALTRGQRFRQPIVEVRVLDVLSLYAVSSAELSVDTLELVGHEHAAGFLLYF